jgi:hypothetical protein
MSLRVSGSEKLPMRAAFLTDLIYVDMITLLISGEEYKLQNSLCSFAVTFGYYI